MKTAIKEYHDSLNESDREICERLFDIITKALPEAEYKIWHRHPVWFLDGNPVVGYHKLKHYVRLLFWSGQSFEETCLLPEGSFKAAEMRFTTVGEIPLKELQRCLKKSKTIQWDYKNIVKRKGKLEKLF